MEEEIINFWKGRTLPKSYQHFPKDFVDLNPGQLAALKISKQIWGRISRKRIISNLGK